MEIRDAMVEKDNQTDLFDFLIPDECFNRKREIFTSMCLSHMHRTDLAGSFSRSKTLLES